MTFPPCRIPSEILLSRLTKPLPTCFLEIFHHVMMYNTHMIAMIATVYMYIYIYMYIIWFRYRHISSQPIDWFDKESAMSSISIQRDQKRPRHWIARRNQSTNSIDRFFIFWVCFRFSTLVPNWRFAARKKAKAKKKRQEMSRQEPKPEGEWWRKYTIKSLEAILISYYLSYYRKM